MRRNIFVLGLLDWQRRELETIAGADRFAFHSLLDHREVVLDHPGFDLLLDRARQQLRNFGGRPDAIVCHWDFPSSSLAPILAAEHGLPSPSLGAILKCEHKYWSRLEQQKAAPECVPDFEAVDPFDPEAGERLTLPFPFWIKPVKGFSSMLGFQIENRAQLDDALAEMRAHIRELGRPFDECLRHADLPPEVAGIGGAHAIAETVMTGRQFAPEGYVRNGKMHIHGFFDMMLDQDGKAVRGLRYPGDLPDALKERSRDVCRRLLETVGFDNGCFNVDFLWDEARDKLWIIEVNCRISQSHCELFRRVDGMSNHEIAVSVALGEAPHFPHERGESAVAAKFHLTKVGDATTTRIPDAHEMDALAREFGALIELNVAEGDQLSELPNQPVYCFNVADVWIGGSSAEDLSRRYRNIAARLPIEFSDGGRFNI